MGGQTVKFTAFRNKEGKIQAKDLKSGIEKGESDQKPRHHGGKGGGKEKLMMDALASMCLGAFAGGVIKHNLKPQKKDTSGGILGEMKGTIENRGDKYGFVKTKKGKVFVSGDELKEYKAGHEIKLTVFKTAEGKLQGMDVKSGLK